jgi:hypothetical protein
MSTLAWATDSASTLERAQLKLCLGGDFFFSTYIFDSSPKTPAQAELGRSTLEYRLRLLEGIAGRDGSVLKASLEPLGALGRAAVGESLGIHSAAGHALEAIVANRGCGLQP